MTKHVVAVLCGIVLASNATGCAEPVRVPAGARLLYFGPPTKINITDPSLSNGQIYLYDEEAQKVLAVMPIFNGAVNVENFPNNHRVRVYLVLPPTTRQS